MTFKYTILISILLVAMSTGNNCPGTGDTYPHFLVEKSISTLSLLNKPTKLANGATANGEFEIGDDKFSIISAKLPEIYYYSEFKIVSNVVELKSLTQSKEIYIRVYLGEKINETCKKEITDKLEKNKLSRSSAINIKTLNNQEFTYYPVKNYLHTDKGLVEKITGIDVKKTEPVKGGQFDTVYDVVFKGSSIMTYQMVEKNLELLKHKVLVNVKNICQEDKIIIQEPKSLLAYDLLNPNKVYLNTNEVLLSQNGKTYKVIELNYNQSNPMNVQLFAHDETSAFEMEFVLPKHDNCSNVLKTLIPQVVQFHTCEDKKFPYLDPLTREVALFDFTKTEINKYSFREEGGRIKRPLFTACNGQDHCTGFALLFDILERCGSLFKKEIDKYARCGFDRDSDSVNIIYIPGAKGHNSGYIYSTNNGSIKLHILDDWIKGVVQNYKVKYELTRDKSSVALVVRFPQDAQIPIDTPYYHLDKKSMNIPIIIIGSCNVVLDRITANKVTTLSIELARKKYRIKKY
jgi:hypothetical protein